MKAKFHDIEVEGTLEEIVKLKNILDTQKQNTIKQWVTIKDTVEINDVIQKIISQLKDSIYKQRSTY